MKFGLVLSGGGARGISHLGVLQALNELDIQFSVLAGTSAGSIVGSLYCYGYAPKKILEIIRNVSLFKSIRPAWTWKGLLTLDGLRDLLLTYMPEDSFSALKIPMTVCATNLQKGVSEYFSEGELIRPITASCCIPGIFSPIEMKESIYVDGGILDNFPASIIRHQCDFLIGVNCNPIAPSFDPRNLKTVVERSMLMAINTNTRHNKSLCDVFIEAPDMANISGFEIGKAQDLFNIGYEYIKKNFRRSDFEHEQ